MLSSTYNKQMEKISSVSNPKIKNVLKLLAKGKSRKEQDLFVFEGARELSLALEGNYDIEMIFVVPELFAHSNYPHVLARVDSEKIVELTKQVFDKIAYREGSDGLVTLAKPKKHLLGELPLSNNPFIIVLEAVEKPGNLGAVLRTADAAKIDAVIVCDPTTDVYNPNAIRSSVGCIFTVPIAVCTSVEAMEFLNKNQICSYAAELNTNTWYHESDFTAPSAIVMGTEADGLSPFWIEHAAQSVKIPMRGKIDSLNVSVSAAIITFEAMRQRKFD